MPISDEEFSRIRKLVYDRFGINLTPQKRGLVVGRLQGMVRSLGFRDFSGYIGHLEQDRTGNTLNDLVNRISTNYTYFFREKGHFDFFMDTALAQFTGKLRQQGGRDLRIWCAGCSTGEEPYALAMLMLEYFGNEYGMWDAGVLATDISLRVLKTAVNGVYSYEQISRLPKTYVTRYFRKEASGGWRIVDKVRREVTFRRFNLMNERFPFKKPFHSIFCRNVMIYFDQPTREALVRRFHAATEPGGYLFIGHSESLGRQNTLYEYVMPAVYRRL